MFALYMAMQVRPPQTSHITILVRTIVPEQQDSVFEDFVLLILNTQVLVDARKVILLEILESSYRVIGKDYKSGFRLSKTMLAFAWSNLTGVDH